MCYHVYHALRCTHHHVIPPQFPSSVFNVLTYMRPYTALYTHQHIIGSILIMLCHTRTNTTLYLIRIVPRFLSALLSNSQYANTYGPLWPYSYTLPVCTYVWPSLALFTHPY